MKYSWLFDKYNNAVQRRKKRKNLHCCVQATIFLNFGIE